VISVHGGETISFPKDNPAFTFELPKELTAKFDKPDHLVFDGGHFYLFETKAQDKEAAKKTMDGIMSVPCQRFAAPRLSTEPATENKQFSGLIVLDAACTASFNEGPAIELRSREFSLDGKRFFNFGFYDSGLTQLVDGMVKSIRPVTAEPASTPSPQK